MGRTESKAFFSIFFFGLKLSPLFIYICNTKQRLGTKTPIHAGLRGSWVKVTRQLGWTPDPQALEGDPSWTPTKPCPRVCGRRRGLVSVSGPHGNVTEEPPGQAEGP